MKLLLKALAALAVLLVLVGGSGYLWASGRSATLLARTIDAHAVDFPIPFPLSDAEIAELQLTPDGADALARERAAERGRHLVEARYGCVDCHGADFGGATMMDSPPMGLFQGPNLTLGQGGATADYGPADWDRIVRHGLRPDGTPAVMPSQDFARMSDKELSDIVSFIRTLPPVDRTMEPVRFGPLGKFLLASGKLPLPADGIPSHDQPHGAEPPETAVTLEFGEHLAATCTGCHGPRLTGGPIVGGDPSWVPAANLTPAADGLRGWTREDFHRLAREGVRPDGSAVQAPMTFALPATQRMTDTEVDALWMYLASLEPLPTGTRD
ncbi:MAG TPA: cytochrome c [Longimicrobiales bacterium]|nr:cytochrome c [Longimicrobiales bacterium]